MRTRLRLRKHRVLVLWTDELPETFTVAAQSFKEIFISGNAQIGARARLGAVELLVPHGGKFSYALLGGSFVPSKGDKLLLRIPQAVENARAIQSESVEARDLRLGVLAEYFDGVASGFAESQFGTPSGTVDLTVGVSSKAGSSLRAFRWTASLLAHVLFAGPMLVQDEVEALLDSIIAKPG